VTERLQHPPLRYRRLRGGYRKEDVEFALAELRLNLHNLGTDLEALRVRARELEEELRSTRAELETSRTRELELSQTMAGILRRANEIEESAHERARAIVAAAEDAAQRSRAEAVRRVEETSGQFNEILRLKENLVGSMRRVVGEFDEALSRVQRGESLFARAVAPEPPPAPPAPSISPPPFEPWPEPSAQAHVHEEPLFRSHVEIDVGPFADVAALSAFERSLAALPRVDGAYVRRLADDRASIELTLSEPTALLATMREHLPYELQVQSANDSKLVLDVLSRVVGTL
jgi:DivIVA protein